jgi:hypothetical protein
MKIKDTLKGTFIFYIYLITIYIYTNEFYYPKSEFFKIA